MSGAQAAVVEFVEDRAAHQLAGAVGMDQVEQARSEFAAQRLDRVDVAALLLGHGEQARVELVLR